MCGAIFCIIDGVGHGRVCFFYQLGFQDRDMFFPIIKALEEVPEIIDIQRRLQQLFQIEAVVNIVVIEQDDVLKAQGTDGLADIAGKAAVVEPVDGFEDLCRGQAIDGFHDRGGIELPHILPDGPDCFSLAFDDLAMLPDARVFVAAEKGLTIDGQVDIEHSVVPCKPGGNVLTVAADVVIPGLEPNDYDIPVPYGGGAEARSGVCIRGKLS